MVKRQDPDNFTCFLMLEWYAWKLAAYVLKLIRNEIIRIYNQGRNDKYSVNGKTGTKPTKKHFVISHDIEPLK